MKDFIEVTDANSDVKVSVNVAHILSFSRNKNGNCHIDLCLFDRDPNTGNSTPIFIECKETYSGFKALQNVVENPYVPIEKLRRALEVLENRALDLSNNLDHDFLIRQGFVDICLLFSIAACLEDK